MTKTMSRRQVKETFHYLVVSVSVDSMGKGGSNHCDHSRSVAYQMHWMGQKTACCMKETVKVTLIHLLILMMMTSMMTHHKIT